MYGRYLSKYVPYRYIPRYASTVKPPLGKNAAGYLSSNGIGIGQGKGKEWVNRWKAPWMGRVKVLDCWG